jgi:hypothetical protein
LQKHNCVLTTLTPCLCPSCVTTACALLSTDNRKLSKCSSINKNCGTGAGAPCCPMSYERGIMYNPPLASPGCPLGMMCETNNATAKCVPNARDCGKIGAKCCVQTSRVGTYVVCGPNGYCSSAAMAAYKGPGFGPVSTLMCEKCPGEKCDTSADRSMGIQGRLDSPADIGLPV